MAHDRTFTDGRLRSSYAAGDISLPPGWTPNNLTGTTPVPGFYSDDRSEFIEIGQGAIDTGNNAWAMLVLAVDILSEVDPDTTGQVALFAGTWLADQPSADLHDGDLVIRQLPAEQDLGRPDDHHVADLEVLLAYRGRWMPIGY